MVQFDLDMTGVTIPTGGSVQACGTFNNWCAAADPTAANGPPGQARGNAAPVPVTQQAYPASGNAYRGSVRLPEGTYEYKYRIVTPGDLEGDFEDVPEACGVQGAISFDQKCTCFW